MPTRQSGSVTPAGDRIKGLMAQVKDLSERLHATETANEQHLKTIEALHTQNLALQKEILQIREAARRQQNSLI